MNPSFSKFKDSSTDCAICLAPLDECEVIELTCGHKWHLECLREQLEHAQPNSARRLLFSGCRCAKCGTFCDHPALQHLTRRADGLREKVDALIADQLQVDVPDVWNQQGTTSASNREALIDEGRRRYAFYLCNSCEEPYFGGTVECADQVEGELASQDRLCVACSPQSQRVCEDPLRHRGHLIWKCRYCCQPSSYVCYGSVHFCSSCHDRNSQRVQQLQRMGRNSVAPPALEPMACPGGSRCPFPKLHGQDRHQNGPSSSCEQVYQCVWCQSSPSRRPVSEQIPEGSTNLIINPHGREGLVGWQQLNPNMAWRVETSEIPVSSDITTNFVSSFVWCRMAQVVPLHRVVTDPSRVRLEVSARYMARTDCPSVFYLEAILIDSQQRRVHSMATPMLDAPQDYWERATLILEPSPGAHSLVMIVTGKDSRFWQGTFGSKVTDCSVRVLGSPEELQQIMREGVAPQAGVRQVGLNPQGDQRRRLLLNHLILPIICLLLFTWLVAF